MEVQVQHSRIASATTEKTQAVKVGVMPLFSTWVYLCENGPAHLNSSLEQLTYRLMEHPENATRRANAGGWHYAFDFFELDEPVVAEFRAHMELHVQAYLDHFRREENKKKDRFRLQGWINVNRSGDSNLLHCHPGCFVSAVYYVKGPAAMRGGEFEGAGDRISIAFNATNP